MEYQQARPEYKDMNLLLFQEEFRTEDDCRQWLFHTRWPKGFQCARCGHDNYTQISTRNLYKCSNCTYQASSTSGTIFHKTKTPLLKWFWLIFRMATSKTGVSIAEMQRELEIRDYKTIWVMAHKIRKAMADRDAQYKLAGLVEIDESFYGPSTSHTRGRGAENKAKLIIAVSVWTDEDGEEKPGFAHAFVANDASAETIGSILQRLGVPDDEITPLIDAIRTDGWQSYKAVAKGFGLVHHRVILTDPKDAMKLLPWTHQLIANAKSVFSGPHRGVSAKHLQSYLSEVCYRFNRRFWHRQAFHRLLTACVSTTTVTRNELLAHT
jgi:transposase-like protein